VDALKHVNIKRVYEIRLRVNRPITVNVENVYRYLAAYGICDRSEQALVVDGAEIEDVVYRAGKFSVYSVEEQIKRGYITADGGARIGLAGEYVFEKGQVHSMRNFSSLCIRIPHEIVGCGEEIYQTCLKDGLKNILIMSSPGMGKTTILRDLARKIGRSSVCNVLVCDERGEIFATDPAENCDVLRFADKRTAFEAGIRAMRPEVIVTDELSKEDCEAVRKAIAGGVKVIASAHISDVFAITAPYCGLFDRYVQLNHQTVGGIAAVYGADLTEIKSG